MYSSGSGQLMMVVCSEVYLVFSLLSRIGLFTREVSKLVKGPVYLSFIRTPCVKPEAHRAFYLVQSTVRGQTKMNPESSASHPLRRALHPTRFFLSTAQGV